MGPPFSLQKPLGNSFQNTSQDAALSEHCLSSRLSAVSAVQVLRFTPDEDEAGVPINHALFPPIKGKRGLTPSPILDHICSSFIARFPGTQDPAEQAHQGHYHPNSLTYPLIEKQGQKVQLPGKLCMDNATGRRGS